MGLTIDYFYSLTPREFHNITKGYAKKQEQETKTSWEQTRSIMFTMAQPNFPKGKRNMKVQQFFPLPWDKKKSAVGSPPLLRGEAQSAGVCKKQRSKKELKAMFAKWDKVKFNKKGVI